jgi:signal transduction histidine kinase
MDQRKPTPPQPNPEINEQLVPSRTLIRSRWLRQWLLPAAPLPRNSTAARQPHLQRVRERILLGLLRIGSLFGTLTLLVAALPWLNDTPPQIYVIDSALLALIWLAAYASRLRYRVRASILLLDVYAVSCTELLWYGFSQDATLLFGFFALLALLLFNLRTGGAALALALATLSSVGMLIASGGFEPLAHPVAALSISTAITTCLIFLMVVGCVQLGIAVLFANLEAVWQHERAARALVEAEQRLLEQRVAERTQELAFARERAEAARQAEAAQKDYLTALYELTLDLLHHHTISDVLRVLVERAAVIMSAPYAELMLDEGQELVVSAFTPNQPFLLGDRVTRDQAVLSWQAFDTLRPVVIDDYSAWARRRNRYASIPLRATADFPIVVGDGCIGVLAFGRAQLGLVFTPEDVQRGTLLAQLAGLLVENARLYETAVREIGERAKAEQALLQQTLELQGQNAELDAFTHTVAHDLKTPLTGMIGHAQLLEEVGPQLAEDDIAISLRAIVRSGQKMSAIINDLLLLAHVRSASNVPFTMLRMRDIVAEAEARLNETLEAARATLIYPQTWPDAHGYAPWVEEVWVNYISNAVKYGGEPPRIELGAEPAGAGFVRLWVQDNGAGLSDEQQRKLFTPFTRLQTAQASGHGLGLSIVQRIVAQLGGEVGIESQLGSGCRFFFTLPAGPATIDER